jgi:hypothetical protein
MTALDTLAALPRWIAWRSEVRNGKATKVPYAPQGGKAKADDPSTWGTRAEAEAHAARIVNGSGGGVGIQLGDLGGDTFLAGIDLDSCLDEDGALAPWAAAILNAVPTYAEKSPSGRGIKAFFYIASAAVRPFLDRIGIQAGNWGCRRGVPGEDARDHGPAIEVYLAGRYFAVTADKWPESPDHVATLDVPQLERLAELIPPVKSSGSSNKDGADNSRSSRAFRIGLAMRGDGKSFDEFCEAVRTDPQTASWYAEKGVANDSRELRRIWEKAATTGETGRLQPLSADEFLALDLPPRGIILEAWLPTQGLAMMHSYRGIGKTLLGLGIAYAVASGGTLLGWSAPEPRRVLYLDGEMPATTMQRRLAAIIAGSGHKPPSPDYLRLLSADITEGGLPDLAGTQGQAEIDAAIGEAELIVVDNISTLVRSGRENEAEGWLPVQGWALAQRRAGRSILFIHHAGKGGLQRGTSRREDVLDTVIKLSRPEDYRTEQGARFEVHFEKARGVIGDDARPFEARYDERDGAAVWTRDGIADDELKRVVDALKSDGLSIRKAAEALGVDKGKVERAKKKAIDRGML